MRTLILTASATLLATSLFSAPPEVPAYQKFMSPDSPQELVAARKAVEAPIAAPPAMTTS